MVAYHFTGNSSSGDSLRSLVDSAISMAHSIGLRVVAVTSDMGPCNQSMWRSYQVNCTRKSMTTFIAHPSEPNCLLHFLADVPHVVKNLCSAFLTHKVFTLGEDIVKERNFLSNEVCLSHVIDLANFQESKQLKLAPKLTAELLTSASHFKKMNVGFALNVFSKSVSAGL